MNVITVQDRLYAGIDFSRHAFQSMIVEYMDMLKDKMHPIFLLFPILLLIIHYALWTAMRPFVNKGLTDRYIWACISFGTVVSWLFIFRRIIPFGSIDPEVLLSIWSTGQGWLALFNQMLMFFGYCFMVYIYYVISATTSNNSDVTFLWRKSVPIIMTMAMAISHNMIDMQSLKKMDPSTVLVMVSWMLRYMMLDALVDMTNFSSAYYNLHPNEMNTVLASGHRILKLITIISCFIFHGVASNSERLLYAIGESEFLLKTLFYSVFLSSVIIDLNPLKM